AEAAESVVVLPTSFDMEAIDQIPRVYQSERTPVDPHALAGVAERAVRIGELSRGQARKSQQTSAASRALELVLLIHRHQSVTDRAGGPSYLGMSAGESIAYIVREFVAAGII